MENTLKNQYQTLMAYHWHVSERLVELAGKLDLAGYYENIGYGQGSIHELLAHLLRADITWRVALETGQQPPSPPPEETPDLAAIQAGFAAQKQAWQKLLESWSEDDIAGEIQLTTRRGQTYPFRRWQVLQHIAFHGMQHHSELAQLLTAKGHSPGNLDFIFFV